MTKLDKASGAEPLYMFRPVLNAEQLHDWARSQGFTSALEPDDMHVTVVFSRSPFSADLSTMARTQEPLDQSQIIIRGGKRAVVPLGDKGAVVLKVESMDLQAEHLGFRSQGASWDYQEYTPHVTITYNGAGMDLSDVEPFQGDIVLGPLIPKPLNSDWDEEIVEVPLQKRQIHDDAFTRPEEAMARSMDLGMGGDIHVHHTADGQAVYMPGYSHEAYLEAFYTSPEAPESAQDMVSTREGLIERVVAAILETAMTHDVTKKAEILKADEDRRIVYGWASVSTVNGELVKDQQGDTIAPEEMAKMADSFMQSVRTAKAMHQGDGIGEVIHSWPLTKDIAAAFGIETNKEGWLVGMKIHDDRIWDLVKQGRLAELSIGGRAGKREPVE